MINIINILQIILSAVLAVIILKFTITISKSFSETEVKKKA